jgi:hypothetical protein
MPGTAPTGGDGFVPVVVVACVVVTVVVAVVAVVTTPARPGETSKAEADTKPPAATTSSATANAMRGLK